MTNNLTLNRLCGMVLGLTLLFGSAGMARADEARLASLNLESSQVATVNLTAPAPAGGASVVLSGGFGANVPMRVHVPAGETSVTFAVQVPPGT